MSMWVGGMRAEREEEVYEGIDFLRAGMNEYAGGEWLLLSKPSPSHIQSLGTEHCRRVLTCLLHLSHSLSSNTGSLQHHLTLVPDIITATDY